MLNKTYLKNKQLQANVFIIYINYFYYYYYYQFFKLLLFYLFVCFSKQARRQLVVLEGYLVPVSTVLVTPDLRGANQSVCPGEQGRYSGVLQHRTSVLTNLSCCWRTRTTSRRSRSRWTSPRRRSQRRRSQRRTKKTRRTNRRTPRPASGS